MSIQISDTSVVDNNKNIVSGTPSVQGTIVKATVSYLAPNGSTAQRPGSPSVGMLFFDTDEGKLVSHNGSEWV